MLLNFRNTFSSLFQNIREVFRFFVPVGILEIMKRRHRLKLLNYNGIKLWCSVFSGSEFEHLKLSKLEYFPVDILRDLKCIVDVGANNGLWTEAVLKIKRPKALIAIEPNVNAFAQLRARVGHQTNVNLLCCAVGAQRGEAAFNIFSSSDFNSLLLPRDGLREYYPDVELLETVSVDVAPLDEILSDIDEISIIKIDVQGNELSVLRGASKALKRTHCILIETNFVSHYQGDSLFPQLHAVMTSEYGFALHDFASLFHDSDGKLLWADAIYINKNMR